MIAQPLILQQVESIVKKLACYRSAEVAIGLFDEEMIEILMFVPEHSQCVFISLLTGQCCDVLIDKPALPDEVECDVGHGDILLEHRAMPAPFTEPLAEDEGAVGEVEKEFDMSIHGSKGKRVENSE